MITKTIDLDKVKTWDDYIYILRTTGFTFRVADDEERFETEFKGLKKYFIGGDGEEYKDSD